MSIEFSMLTPWRMGVILSSKLNCFVWKGNIKHCVILLFLAFLDDVQLKLPLGIPVDIHFAVEHIIQTSTS